MGKEYLKSEERKENFGPELLIFARHAESERNAAKGNNVRFPDECSLGPVRGIPSYEISLTEKGVLQAKRLGQDLSKRFGMVDVIYHSGYKTTIQTVEGILTAYQDDLLTRPKIVQDFLTRERDQGFVYDMHNEEIEEQFPWLREYWQTFGRFFGKAPGSENLAQVAERARYFLDDLFRFKSEKSVLVVTHVGTFQTFRFLMEGWTYEGANWRMDHQIPGNCAVVAYGSPDFGRRLHMGSEKPSYIDLRYRPQRSS